MAPYPSFSLSTLGELRLAGPAGTVLAGRRKELVLLTYISRRAPRTVPRDELAALLWGERDEDKARQSLRHALHQLRRALGDAIEVTGEHVRAMEGAIEVDASALEQDIGHARLAEGVQRWKGEFLRGAEDAGAESYREWLEREREAIRRVVVTALSRLVADAQADARIDDAVRWARHWADLFPLDDTAHVRLVETLLRSGNVESARTAHVSFLARLRNELDVVPSLEMIRLGEQLVRAPRQEQERRPGSAALLTPDLVGRDAIMASLLELWSRGGAEGAVVVIEGEEGSGKSRLAHELLRRVRDASRPSMLLEARAEEEDRNSTWATLRRLMPALVSSSAIEEAPNKALSELSEVLPALRERFPHLTQPTGSLGRLETSLRDVLRVMASSVPALIVVDDFGNADTESQKLLGSLFADPPRGVLVLLTLRADEPLEAKLAFELGELRSVRRFKLAPLEEVDVAALIGSMLEMTPTDRARLAERLSAESGGHPFYITSLVSSLADAGALRLNQEGVWRLDPEFASREMPLPPGLRGAIRARLSHLSERARRLIDALSTLDAPVAADRAREVAGLEPDAFDGAIDELLSRRLIRPAASGPETYAFTHQLIRRVTAESLDAETRSASIARALPLVSASGAPALAEDARRHTRRRRAIGAAAAGILLLAAGALAVTYKRGWWPSGAAAPNDAAPRVAVLDLELLTRDTLDSYLASGLAEEINSSLSRFEDVRIKSRGAVRTVRGSGIVDPVQLGKALRVDYLVEGSLRHVGQRLKIAIRLTKTADGFQVWSGDFDAAEGALPALHDRIAKEVAARIGTRLSPSEIASARRPLTADAQAYEHYLRGNYYLARRTPPAVEQAIAQYRLAVARDSAFAAARARIAYGYSLLLDWGWAHGTRSTQEILHEGLALVESALELDSLSADAWMARAYLLESADPVFMRGAAEAFERAIALNPRNTEALHQYAQVHEALGTWDQAKEAFRRTLLLEPDRSLPYVAMASIAWKQGKVSEARRLYDTALVVDPGASYVLSARATLRIFGQGDLSGGLEDAETAVRVEEGYSIPPHSVLAVALARSGSEARAQLEVDHALSEIVDPNAPSPTDARWISSALLALGRRTEALSLLERARPRGAWLWFYCLAPDFDPIRTDPRFMAVMREARPPRDSKQ